MSASSDKLKYGDAIKNKAGANVSASTAFFLASEAQKGPLGGSAVPDEYTNTGLYDIANNLLATDNLFYSTSALHGYAESLTTFLNWVDTGAKPSKALDTAYLNALKDQAAADNAYWTQLDKAQERYQKSSDMGMVPEGQSFPKWVAAGNFPQLQTADKARKAAATTTIGIQSQMAGPMAAQLQGDRTKVEQGLNKDQDLDGFNMQCAIGNVLSPQELIRRLNNNEEIPKPTIQRLPLYQAPGYKDFVEAAERKTGSTYEPANSIEFSIDTSKNTSDYDFGHTSGSAGVTAGWAPWFFFSSGASSSTTNTNINTGSESQSVKVKMTYDEMRIVPITLGDWNVDISKYKLRSDAPKAMKTLARVHALIVVSGLGYEITVGAQTASQIDTNYKKTTKAGGRITIFGIPIHVGGSGTSTKEVNSHKATWDKASATFKVVPAQDAGYATVVGVVGEKFSIL
ncbi:hypothetical protein QBC43DRAFT_354274 [Cladorrhinum sp. PSN259]|nr:hypothetical protein QBC43DRAFT_354274 [Cladorrhinum sp. PSN259]